MQHITFGVTHSRELRQTEQSFGHLRSRTLCTTFVSCEHYGAPGVFLTLTERPPSAPARTFCRSIIGTMKTYLYVRCIEKGQGGIHKSARLHQ